MSDLENHSDDELQSLNIKARSDLEAGKKELNNLVESGLIQPDDQVLELRARNKSNQQLVNETARIQKTRVEDNGKTT